MSQRSMKISEEDKREEKDIRASDTNSNQADTLPMAPAFAALLPTGMSLLEVGNPTIRLEALGRESKEESALSRRSC